MTTNPPASSAGILGPHSEARHVKALEAIFGEHFVATFQSPYVVREGAVISCPVAQRFFRKDFSYLSKQLYIEYQYRSWRGFPQEYLDRYANIVATKITQIETHMKNWVNRCQKLLDQNGKSGEALSLWPTSMTVDVPIIAAQAGRYIDLLLLMERVYALAATCNLYGLLDSQQRAEMERTCKRALRAFRSVLQNEVGRLYREAQRIQSEQRARGEENPQMAALVEAQGQSISEFERQAKEDERQDGPDGAMDAQSASEVLDAVGALAAAAGNGATTRKRGTTAKKAEPAAAPATATPASPAGTEQAQATTAA